MLKEYHITFVSIPRFLTNSANELGKLVKFFTFEILSLVNIAQKIVSSIYLMAGKLHCKYVQFLIVSTFHCNLAVRFTFFTIYSMAFPLVEFSRQGYKIRKVFG